VKMSSSAHIATRRKALMRLLAHAVLYQTG
jgi:hypothetical protein